MSRKTSKEPKGPQSADEFVRSLLSFEVGNLLKFDPVARQGHDPEGIHQLRVSARRLRSELKIVAPVWRSAPLKDLQRELQWFGQVLGEQRDLDVLRGVLSSVNEKISPRMDSSVFDRLDREQIEKSRRVVELLESQRYRQLIGTLSESVIRPPLRSVACEPMVLILRPALNAALTKIFSTVDDLGPAPSNEDLHRIRILAKRGRYSAEISSPLLGSVAKDVGKSLELVQTVLGDLHDCLAAVSYLEEERSRLNEREYDPGKALSLPPALRRLGESIERLKTQWREPLGAARELSGSISMSSVEGLDGSGVQHEI
jgi:CHAD domain-containing protein